MRDNKNDEIVGRRAIDENAVDLCNTSDTEDGQVEGKSPKITRRIVQPAIANAAPVMTTLPLTAKPSPTIGIWMPLSRPGGRGRAATLPAWLAEKERNGASQLFGNKRKEPEVSGSGNRSGPNGEVEGAIPKKPMRPSGNDPHSSGDKNNDSFRSPQQGASHDNNHNPPASPGQQSRTVLSHNNNAPASPRQQSKLFSSQKKNASETTAVCCIRARI